MVSKIVEGVFVPRLNSPNERVWNGRLWREADIRRSVGFSYGRRPRMRPDVQGRATSNGCTYSPPAMRGFDGSKRSRIVDEQARHNKGVLQACSLPECDIEKGIAEIGPFGFVIALGHCAQP